MSSAGRMRHRDASPGLGLQSLSHRVSLLSPCLLQPPLQKVGGEGAWDRAGEGPAASLV